MKDFDNSFLTDKIKLIAGVDEVGRGPLAGPVVSAAVIFDEHISIEGINDSKKLTAKEREYLFPLIIKNAAAFSVAAVSHGLIDRINILQASLRSMHLAVKRLKILPDLILVDGNKTFDYSVPVIPVIKGDSKSFSIAAASIIAKVLRDRLMKRLDNYFPQYLWSKNKGYPTKDHIHAIKLYGICSLHRKSFLKKILSQDNSGNIVDPDAKLIISEESDYF
jgi:ribonuclease HII